MVLPPPPPPLPFPLQIPLPYPPSARYYPDQRSLVEQWVPHIRAADGARDTKARPCPRRGVLRLAAFATRVACPISTG